MNTWTVIHLQVPGISHLHSYKYATNIVTVQQMAFYTSALPRQ